MLQLSLAEFFIRLIPEGLMAILAVYTFSKTKVDIKRYIGAALSCAIITFFIRKLPITYGIHTILIIIAIILLAIYINKIEIVDAIKATIISFAIQFMAEYINILFIEHILCANVDEVLNDARSRLIYGFPSIVIGITIVSLYYIYLSKKDALKNSEC